MPFTLGAYIRAMHGAYFICRVQAQAASPPTIASHFELADQFQTTSPVMQTPEGIAFGYIVGRQKGFTAGTGSIGPIYEMQVAFDSGFTSQVRTVSQFTARRTTDDQTWEQEMVVPDAQTYTFARMRISLSGTDAITADFMIDLLPGQ